MNWRQALTELERTLHQYSETLELLREIDAELAKHAFHLDRVLSLIAKGAQRLTQADLCDILLPDSPTELRIEWSTDPKLYRKRVPIEHSVTGAVLSSGKAIRVGDVQALGGRYFPLVSGTMSELAIPMQDENNDIIAIINLQSTSRDFFTEDHERFISMLAGQGAVAIRNAAVHEQFMSILELSSSLDPTSSTLRPVLTAIGMRARELTQAEHCQVMVPFDDELIVEFTTGPEEVGATRLRVDNSISGRAYTTAKPIRIDDVEESELSSMYRPFLASGMKSELVIPISWRNEVLAVINLESPRPQAFREHHERLASLLAEHAAVALANTKRFQRILWASQAQGELWTMAQIGDVYGPLIHRLNSDAGAIGAILNQLRVRFPDRDPRLDEMLCDIQDKATQILDIPRKLRRNLERVQVYEQANLNDLVERFLKSYSHLPDLHLHAALDPALPDIRISAQVEDLVEVLIGNAVEAIGEQGHVEVETRPWSSRPLTGSTIGHGVEILVSDGCGGIPENIANHIWDIGFTTKPKRGLGFGLWWARNFVERMGGNISLHRQVLLNHGGIGCCFVVRLPFEARKTPITSHQTAEGGVA